MEEIISAAEANRKFSELLRKVGHGRRFIVTSHGKPVARLTPTGEADAVAEGARRTLVARLRRQRVVDIGRWRRDELYEA